jgi:hypothetical protein
MTHPALSRVLVLSLLMGCSKPPYTEEEFNHDVAEAECSLMMECEPMYQNIFASVEECVVFNQTVGSHETAEGLQQDTSGSERESDCTFNSDKARECISVYKSLTCDDIRPPAESRLEERMAVCNEVYTGDCGNSYDTGR